MPRRRAAKPGQVLSNATLFVMCGCIVQRIERTDSVTFKRIAVTRTDAPCPFHLQQPYLPGVIHPHDGAPPYPNGDDGSVTQLPDPDESEPEPASPRRRRRA